MNMSIDAAKAKLAEMKAELARIPEHCHARADREYRVYLELNIDQFAEAIESFEAVANNGDAVTKCECGRMFDPAHEGGNPARKNKHDRPAVCGQCLHDIIIGNKL